MSIEASWPSCDVFFFSFLFLVVLFLFIPPLNTITFITFSASLQPQIKLFLLPFKTLKPHILFEVLLPNSHQIVHKQPLNSYHNHKTLSSIILNSRSTHSPNPKPTTTTNVDKFSYLSYVNLLKSKNDWECKRGLESW